MSAAANIGSPVIDLRLGDWRTALADVEMVDAVITDPPYSQRTEDGFRSGSGGMDAATSPGMGYDPITEDYCRAFVASWAPRNRGWFVVCGDHLTFRWWESALGGAGLYVFPPVVIAKTNAAPRMSGDGPGSHCEYMAVARPKKKAFLSWGALPGWYAMDTVRALFGHNGVSGAKSLATMQAVVRDYSRRGDLVCDPHAGSGTTLIAAAAEGRRSVGAEILPKHHAISARRIARGYTPALFAEGA